MDLYNYIINYIDRDMESESVICKVRTLTIILFPGLNKTFNNKNSKHSIQQVVDNSYFMFIFYV